MNNEPKSGNEQVGDNLPQELLENMPSFEEHINNLEMDISSNDMSPERKTEIKEREALKEKFIKEDYNYLYWNTDFYKHSPDISSEYAISRHQEKMTESYRNGYGQAINYLSDIIASMSKMNAELKPLNVQQEAARGIEGVRPILEEVEKNKNMHYEAIKKLRGEWSPFSMENKYGHFVEDYGVSLADVNIVLRSARNSDSADKGASYYEYFCEKLPDIIEKHFSDNVSEDHKQTICSIIGKVIKNSNKYEKEQIKYDIAKEEYYSKEENKYNEYEAEIPSLKEISLSEHEIEFLAEEYTVAIKNSDRSYDLRYFLDNNGAFHTNDKLLDGIIINVLVASPEKPLAKTEIGKKIEERLSNN